MALTPDEILAELRALPPAERLRVVERVVHEVAEEVTPEAPPVEVSDAIWADESDSDFEEFQNAVRQMRAVDMWRADDGKKPR
jgi:hypothetical protein